MEYRGVLSQVHQLRLMEGRLPFLRNHFYDSTTPIGIVAIFFGSPIRRSTLDIILKGP
jgi:hypothetical protein